MNEQAVYLFSIVIPVFNVEAFLPACLQSLDNQGLEENDFEVILVNDGSIDGSLSICEQYAIQHHNVHILSQENSGVSAARNKGLDVAKGKYVIFVDSDDFLAKNGLKQLSDVVQNHPEADLIRYYSSYSTHPKEGDYREIDYEGGAEELLKLGGYPAFIWTFAYRKTFLDKNHIRFKTLQFSEDGLFIATTYLHNPFIVSTRANIYRYVMRHDSAIGDRSREKSRKCAEDGITAYEMIREEMKRSCFSANEAVKSACTNSENFKKNACYSRLLGAGYHRKEFVQLKRRIEDNEFYPVIPWSQSKRTKFVCSVVNFMFSSFPIYQLSSFLFVNIFTRYILPAYRRRVWAKG